MKMGKFARFLIEQFFFLNLIYSEYKSPSPLGAGVGFIDCMSTVG